MLLEHLNQGHNLNKLNLENDFMNEFNLLTDKPMLFAVNIDEQQINKSHKSNLLNDLEKFLSERNEKFLHICSALEQEISNLEEEEQIEYLKEFELKEPALNTLIRTAYKLLSLHTFFTAGPEEIRAWTIKLNDTAYDAAGKIHTDFQKGFIKAEIYHFDDLMKYKSEVSVKEAGLIRQEGKDYIMKDGDMVLFKFNVTN